jgi:hypothetical protein
MELRDRGNIKPPQALPRNVPEASFAKLILGFEQAGNRGMAHGRLLANQAALANLSRQKYLVCRFNLTERPR